MLLPTPLLSRCFCRCICTPPAPFAVCHCQVAESFRIYDGVLPPARDFKDFKDFKAL